MDTHLNKLIFLSVFTIFSLLQSSKLAASWNDDQVYYYNVYDDGLTSAMSADTGTQSFVEGNEGGFLSSPPTYSNNWHRNQNGHNPYSLIYVAKQRINGVPTLEGNVLFESSTHYYIFTRQSGEETLSVDNRVYNINFAAGSVYLFNKPERCRTNGGFAADLGLKIWCWEDFSIPEYDALGVNISDGQLKTNVECDSKSVAIVGNQIKFHLDPLTSPLPNWCSRNYNMRAEVSSRPWHVDQPLGTEEWFGWSYTFADDYAIDRNNEWLFFQVHPGIIGLSPQVELMMIKDGQYSGHSAGEIYVINKGNYPDNNPTGITPVAGQTLDIVVHVIYGDASNGLFQVWMNGISVYDKQVSTIYADYPWGGNAKWGIYKWPWNNTDDVQLSLDQGITHLETTMGPLRILTRSPGDPDYGQNAYSLVDPVTDNATTGGTIKTIGKPELNRSSDVGLFIWESTKNNWVINVLSADQQRTVEVDVLSQQSLSNVLPVSIEPNDVFRQLANGLDMSLNVISPWVDGVKFTAQDQSSACVSVTNTDVPIYLGPDHIEMPGAFDLSTLESCNLPNIKTIGKPVLDRSTHVGIFIWESTKNNWVMNVLSGNRQRRVEVDVLSQKALSNVLPVSIESSDVFTQLPNSLDMSLNIQAPWIDGVKFTIQDQSGTCVSTTNSDVPVYIGPQRINVGNNFNLNTLTGCQ